MSDTGSSQSVAQILNTLETIEHNMDRPTTVQELNASLANLTQVESMLPKAEVSDTERNLLRDRLKAVKTKNKKKLNSVLPWPMVIFTNVPHSKNKTELVDLLDHSIYWVRNSAARTLQFAIDALSKEPQAVTELCNSLYQLSMHPDPDARWYALDLWLRVPVETADKNGLTARTHQWIEEALNDSEPEICAAAIRGLTLYKPAGYEARLRDLVVTAPHEAVQEQARELSTSSDAAKKPEHCVVCGRIPPKRLAHLFSNFTANASDDYTMAGGASSPFINAACIPVPPRNPFDPNEWLTVRQQWRAEVIAMSRDNRKKKPDWDPAWVVCGHCAKALDVPPDAMAKALAEAVKYFQGEPAVGVLTANGQRFKEQVASNCFVCSIVLDVSAPELDVFRDFRDDCLTKTPAGRAFTRLYYVVGPHLATCVARRPSFRRSAHGVLLRFLPYMRRATEAQRMACASGRQQETKPKMQ